MPILGGWANFQVVVSVKGLNTLNGWVKLRERAGSRTMKPVPLITCINERKYIIECCHIFAASRYQYAS